MELTFNSQNTAHHLTNTKINFIKMEVGNQNNHISQKTFLPKAHKLRLQFSGATKIFNSYK